MIKAVIFDLDGTLIQTEELKARSYAEAIHLLTQKTVSVQRVLNGFKDYVGLSRMEVVAGLVEEFGPQLQNYFGKDNPEGISQWLLTKRLSIYKKMVGNKQLLRAHFCPFNLELLHTLYNDGFKLALATMSHLSEAGKVLDVMGIRDKLDFIITRDDVDKGKPDPEIYIKATDLLQLAPKECLVLEDSLNGIKAALHAGLHVFAVTNDITRLSVHDANIVPQKYIVDNNEELEGRVYHFLSEELTQSEFQNSSQPFEVKSDR